MTRPSLSLYEKVTPASWPPTLEGVWALAQHDPAIRGPLVMAERGTITQEQALYAVICILYESRRVYFNQVLELISCRPPAPITLNAEV